MAKSGFSYQVDRGQAARARTRLSPTGAAALLTNCRDMRYIILCPRLSRGCRVQAENYRVGIAAHYQKRAHNPLLVAADREL